MSEILATYLKLDSLRFIVLRSMFLPDQLLDQLPIIFKLFNRADV